MTETIKKEPGKSLQEIQTEFQKLLQDYTFDRRENSFGEKGDPIYGKILEQLYGLIDQARQHDERMYHSYMLEVINMINDLDQKLKNTLIKYLQDGERTKED